MTEWTTLLQHDDYLGIKKHLKTGGDLKQRTESGESVLAMALRLRCSDEVLELLCEFGASLYDFDDEGVSVFDNAITYNSVMMVKKILDNGIDVNATRRGSGFTPLMAAVCYNRRAIVEMLLGAGADPRGTDNKGLDSLDYARRTHRKSMIPLLEAADHPE